MATTRSILLFAIFLLACNAEAQPLVTPPPPYVPDPAAYRFVARDAAPLVRMDQAFPAPAGYRRLELPATGFGAWLRVLPLFADRTEVRSYRGHPLVSPAAAIVPIDVGERDLQQCADSIIRLHAEYLWARGRSDALRYHFTSGDEVRYADWVAGERVRAEGSRVTRSLGRRRSDDRASMRRWLDLVFMYAGTRSLSLDSRAVAPGEVLPGDFFVAPGSPGHAVMVLDVAVDDDGTRVALLGQGFMPAQEFHVLRATGDAVINDTWFVLPTTEEGELQTPSWEPFYGSDARRFIE